jgi:sulfate transport system substrate-binding protein
MTWGAGAQTFLNVSYDPTRELYQEFNKSFAEHWKQKTGKELTLRQSHGGSGKQARSVFSGLEADVVTLALAYDIDMLKGKAALVPVDWQTRMPNNSCPYTSTVVFLVRQGNPKAIKDWNDLIQDGVSVITPNPKTSGGARWNYLAAWGYALRHNNSDAAKAKEFVSGMFRNVPVLNTGAREATTSFVDRGLGDVLVTWENEALLAVNKMSKGGFEIIRPSLSILAEPPVAVVDKYADKHGNREVAEAYLNYLYTEQGQEICAKNYYRPVNETVAKKYEQQFPKIELFTIKDVFGDWPAAHAAHFADGAVFDQIMTK